jgi:hypothetical protein
MYITSRSLQGLWLKALLFVLFGYAVLGKGFAYLFLGEAVCLMGLLLFLLSRRMMLVASDSLLSVWALFAFWGLCRTVPFLHRYGFDAVRDAVLWGYGSFALLIVAFVNNSNQIARALGAYRRFLRWYLPALPFLLVLPLVLEEYIPDLPWAHGVGLLSLKGGDAAVHLAGAGLFLLLIPRRRAGKGVSVYGIVGFVAWCAALLIVMLGRGGFVAVVISVALAAVVRARKIGWKVGTLAISAAFVALLVIGSGLITLKNQAGSRSLSADQIRENVSSIVGSSNRVDLEGSKEWRLEWWRNIVRYTVFGPYRWTGKGFGVNLAVEDGPPGVSPEETKLRSPHSGNMTVLARMGIPGALLWGALNFIFVFRLVRAYRRAERAASPFWSGVNLWLLCYWLAAFINMSFDVYIEGPQGGIWFWSLIGFGVAALRVQAYEARKLAAQAQLQTEESARLEYVPAGA